MRFLDVLTLLGSLYMVSDNFILSFAIIFLVTPFIYAEELFRVSVEKIRIRVEKQLEKEKILKNPLKEEQKEQPKQEEEIETKN